MVLSYLPLLTEAINLFVQPLPVLVYGVAVPIIDAFSEPSDTQCHFYSAPFALHTTLFLSVIIVTALYVCLCELGCYNLKPPAFQKIAKRFFARLLSRHTDPHDLVVMFCSFFFQVLLTAFFALFLGPEPLACWWAIGTAADFAGFEIGRAMANLIMGSTLFLFVFCMNMYGRSATNTSSSPLVK